MPYESLADRILPKALRDGLRRIVGARGALAANGKRQVSYYTRDFRYAAVALFFAQLRELGYNLESPSSLRHTHVKVLVAHWVERGVCAGKLHTYLSILRQYASWIGKPDMVGRLRDYVEDKQRIKRTTVATRDRAWSARNVSFAAVVNLVEQTDPYVAIYLRLMRAMGLRLREAVCLKPLRDIVEWKFLSVRDGTKGGRHRMVAIKTPEQIEVLEDALRMTCKRTGRISPQHMSDKQSYRRAYYVMSQAGLTRADLGVTSHGLRHEFAHDVYLEITGKPAPIAGGKPGDVDRDTRRRAEYRVSEALGHGRRDVGGMYNGSHGHATRRDPKGPTQSIQKIGGNVCLVTILCPEAPAQPEADPADVQPELPP